MKLYNAKFLTIIFLFLIAGCTSQEENNLKEDSTFTIKEAEAIVKKYNLNDGTFVFKKKDTMSGASLKKFKDVKSKQPLLSKKDFEKFVAEAARYQQSKKGRMAKKMNAFFNKERVTPLTKKQIDSFYLAIDNEFDTDLYKRFGGAVKEGQTRVTKFGNTPKKVERNEN